MVLVRETASEETGAIWGNQAGGERRTASPGIQVGLL